MHDVAFDTETTGLRWDQNARPFMVQWASAANPRGDHALLGPAGVRDPDALAAAHRALESADRLIAHNAPFDVHMWRAGTNRDLLRTGARILDTKTLAQIVLPERRTAEMKDGRGYHLKDLAREFVDPDAKDSEDVLERLAREHGFHLKASPGGQYYRDAAYFELWKHEPAAMEFYGREDTRLTLGLLHALEAKLTPETRRIWELEQRVAPIVIGAEAKGIRVDQEKAAPLRAEYAAAAEQARTTLDAELMEGWDDNNDMLAEALLKAGVPLTETTESGQIATNKWAIERLAGAHPIIDTLLEYRTASKFVSTYLDHFVGTDVIHPSFNPIGTWTGRMSGVQPNMQNIPVRAGKQVRELFIPRPGYAFAALDYEQIEFRALCYYLNDRRMIELMESGHDPFAQLAADVNIPGQLNGGTAADYVKGAPGEAKRVICKNTTYAVIYGAGGMKVAKMLGWEPDSVYTANDFVVKQGYKRAGEPRSKAAEALVKQIKSALIGYGTPPYRGPGSGSGLMGRVHDKVAQTGSVNTIMGRRQWIGYDGGYKALSGLIQGSAADIFKQGLIDATEAVKPLGAYPLLFIHDEIVFETPVEAAEEVLQVAGGAMNGAYDLRPALAVEGHIAYNNWGEAK